MIRFAKIAALLITLLLWCSSLASAGIPLGGHIESFAPGIFKTNTHTTLTMKVKNTGTSTYFEVRLESVPSGWTVSNITPAAVIINNGNTHPFQLVVNPNFSTGNAAIHVEVYAYQDLTDPILVDSVNLLVKGMAPPGTFFIQTPGIDEVVPSGALPISWTVPGDVLGYDMKIYKTNGSSLQQPPVLTVTDLQQPYYSWDTSFLEKGQEYAIFVEAFNEVASTASVDSPRKFIVAAADPPGAFDLTSPAADAKTNLRPTFSWTASQFAETYTVNVLPEQNGAPVGNPVRVITGVTSTSYTWVDPPLAAGKYYVSVNAVSEGGVRLNRQGLVRFQATALTPFNRIEPTFGSSMQATRPTFRWESVPAADRYYLYVFNADAELYDFQVVPQQPGNAEIAVLWMESHPLQPAQTFYWYVAALAGTEPQFNEGFNWNFSTTPLRAFDLLTPASGSIGAPLKPQFTWQEAPAAVRYQAQVAPVRADGSPDVGARQESPLLTVPEWSGSTLFLTNDKLYAWRVNASDGTNGTYNYGSWQPFRTTVFTQDFDLLLPANEATDVLPQPVLRWESVGVATDYRVAIGAEGEWLLPEIYTDVPEVDLELAGVQLNGLKKYYWVVWALAANGEELLVNSAFSFTTGARTDVDTCDVPQHLLGLQTLSEDERLQLGSFGTMDAAELIRLRNLPDSPVCN